jgi:hypothetical protein
MDLLFQTLSEDCCCAKNKHPSWTRSRKFFKYRARKAKESLKYKTKVTFALSLVGDRIPEVCNTYEQRRSYYVEVLTHRLASHCGVPIPVKTRNRKLNAWNLHPRHE